MDEFENRVSRLIALALEEDIGDGDITTNAVISTGDLLTGRVFAKQDGRIAGLKIVDMLYAQFFKDISIVFKCKDGERVKNGQKILEISGPGRVLLSTERLVLNILQRMSGIATKTNTFVEKITGTKAVILDTRKTAPGLRLLDKMAVRLGGGTNHRMGLFDSYLIKENHIEGAGGLAEAVRRVRASNAAGRSVEVEVRTIPELQEALAVQVDMILLDNMSRETMKKAVELTAGRVPLEASGNVTLENVREVAETGVDFISVGALTHSVQALDLSLIIERT
ncbi:MAG TPA: carboxylating nicotinate-nucleotide diphosphorylase [Bacteroidota bacterium]